MNSGSRHKTGGRANLITYMPYILSYIISLLEQEVNREFNAPSFSPRPSGILALVTRLETEQI
jgi:hypothetical protein